MKIHPHYPTRNPSRYHYLYNLVQATHGEPRLVGRTTAVCKSGTSLRPVQPPHLVVGRRPTAPTVSRSISLRGRRRSRNRRARISPGVSLRELYLLNHTVDINMTVTEQEDIALKLEESIAAASLLEEVSPEWKVVDDIAVDFLEKQAKPEWKDEKTETMKRNSFDESNTQTFDMHISKMPSPTSPISPPLTPTLKSASIPNTPPPSALPTFTSPPHSAPTSIPSAIPTFNPNANLTSIPNFQSSIPGFPFPTSIPTFPTSIPIPTAIPTAIPQHFQSGIPTFPTSIPTAIPTAIPTSNQFDAQNGFRMTLPVPESKVEDSPAPSPRASKSNRKGSAGKNDNAKGGAKGANAKGAPANKKGGADAKQDAKGGPKKGGQAPAGAKPVIGAKNADKPVAPKGPAPGSKDSKPAGRAPAGKKPVDNAAASANNKAGGKPTSGRTSGKTSPVPRDPKEPAGGKKVGFKGPADTSLKGKGGPAPKPSKSSRMGNGPMPKMSKSTPGLGKDINIEKYTQQILKLKKALQENTNVVNILEKQLIADGQGREQSGAEAVLREQMVRFDIELQGARTRMKELEDLYVAEKLGREEDKKTIKQLETARDELKNLYEALQRQEKQMRETYEAKISMLTTTVQGLQMTNQDQRYRFEESRNAFSFIPPSTSPTPRVSFSTFQMPNQGPSQAPNPMPKPLVIPPTFAMAQSPPLMPSRAQSPTFMGTPSRAQSPTFMGTPARRLSIPLSSLPSPMMSSIEVDSSVSDKEKIALLEAKLNETRESLNKEWKERIELEEKYAKERQELEKQLAFEKRERTTYEEKYKLEQFTKTQLDARLAIAERELSGLRRASEAVPPPSTISQWPPPSPQMGGKFIAPSQIKAGGGVVGGGGFQSIKMRLAEAGIQ